MDLRYIDLDRRFDPGVLIRSVFFVTGAPYSRHDHDRTLNRLMNLGVFKYVDVRFSQGGQFTTGRTDLSDPAVDEVVAF